MEATNLIQLFISLILSIQITVAPGESSTRPSVSLTKPAHIATLTDKTVIAAEIDEIATWIIVDEESLWSADEAITLQHILQNTFAALEVNGIDGKALLDRYRFRREAGPYVGDVEGRMGTIDHNVGVITLSDEAFVVLNGFAIYHELGHAVDFLLNRQLTDGFHRYTGGPELNMDPQQWQTADNYWLRLQGRNDREEAAADAFAVLIMSHAGIKRPIFAKQPVTADYDDISAAAALALQTSELPNQEK